MTDQFESQKNLKATGYTALVCTLLLIAFFLVSWTYYPSPAPLQEDGIEVNLGNSDQGSGHDQPYLPGQPAEQEHTKYTPPKQAVVEKEAVKDVETDDNNKEDAPVIKKPPVTKPNATKLPTKEIAPPKSKPVKQPEVAPTPAPPKPRVAKAKMGSISGNGTGGNDADDYKPGTGEGVAGGAGDQGRPGGNPDSKNYAGGGRGNNGISITRGLNGRHITGLPSFTDDFNQNAKVAVDVHVDGSGNVTDADYQPRGSTTSDGSMKAIALRKAKQVRFNGTGEESVGTIVFNFRVHN